MGFTWQSTPLERILIKLSHSVINVGRIISRLNLFDNQTSFGLSLSEDEVGGMDGGGNSFVVGVIKWGYELIKFIFNGVVCVFD